MQTSSPLRQTSVKGAAYTAAILSFAEAGLIILLVALYVTKPHDDCDYEDLKNFNVPCIKDYWKVQRDNRFFDFAVNIVGALGAFALMPPVVALGDLFSSYRLASGRTMVISFLLALGINIVEFIFEAGEHSTADWISSEFNLGDAEWKALMLSHFMVRGQGVWLYALDEFFLCIGLWSAAYANGKTGSLGKGWTVMSWIMGALAFINFCVELARSGSWSLFSEIGFISVSVLGFVLIPIWVIWLACKIDSAVARGPGNHVALSGEHDNSMGAAGGFGPSDDANDREKADFMDDEEEHDDVSMSRQDSEDAAGDVELTHVRPNMV